MVRRMILSILLIKYSFYNRHTSHAVASSDFFYDIEVFPSVLNHIEFYSYGLEFRLAQGAHHTKFQITYFLHQAAIFEFLAYFYD